MSTALQVDLPDAAARRPPPLLLHNLLNDFEALARLVWTEVARDSWLNAYLLAVGLNQVLEDYLQREPYAIGKLSTYLTRLPEPGRRVVRAGLDRSAIGARWLRSAPPARHRLKGLQAELAELVADLAEAALAAESVTSDPGGIRPRLRSLLRSFPRLPIDLRRSVVRLPACFRSFDQRPEDLGRIVEAFAERWPDRTRQLAVVGIRTSGSYLGPLFGAHLRRRGYRNVHDFTLRLSQHWLEHQERSLRAVARAGGLALLTDDPPASGRSLASAGERLERLGFAQKSIVLLLQLPDPPEKLSPQLAKYPTLILPWDQWAIHQLLRPDAVREALVELMGDTATVGRVERLTWPERARARGHVLARYRVEVREIDGNLREQEVYVKGAGLGYFGEHSLAVTQALADFVPTVYGLRDGLLYREWLPEEQRLTVVEGGAEWAVAGRIARYVAHRNRVLAVDEDVSSRLVDRNALWQYAGHIIGQAFGRAKPLMRPVLHRTAKRLMQVRRPSVIDGGTDLSNWFARPDGLAKVNFDERAFSSVDRFCYDPVFDLAVAGAMPEARPLEVPLRQTYVELTGEPIDAERWVIYQLQYLGEKGWDPNADPYQLNQMMTRSLQDYFSAVYFQDVSIPGSGELCAIDIDGVLETPWLGFPGISPAGALTLRALARHGYRPVLVSGRSVDEIRDRCRAYRLVGGVAEYGAIVYDHRSQSTYALLDGPQRLHLDRIREALSGFEGIGLDAAYQGAIRAYQLEGSQRRGLPADMIHRVLRNSGVGDMVRAIPGFAQTDFMVADVDKGSGLRALAAQLGVAAGTDRHLAALAVGDTESDLSMFRLAQRRYAPSTADRALQGAGVRFLPRPHQAGLALAAEKLLGHGPGACDRCRPPHLSPAARMFLAALAAHDQNRFGKLRQGLRLAMQVRAAR